MPFNSLHFAVFLTILFVLYYSMPFKIRWILLLVSSCYFYMTFIPVYLIVGFVLIMINYLGGIFIYNKPEKGKILLLILLNLLFLVFFKYYNFLNSNITSFLGIINVENPIPFMNILLPVGISFQIFQNISYLIDIYRRNQKPEKHIGIFALYNLFFPKLIAGPIERAGKLIPQFYEKHNFNYLLITDGLKLFAWGIIKKFVIADRLAVISDTVFNNFESLNIFALILGILAFSLQIYLDFSGYTDMAIGIAQVLGFRLTNNFKRPYFSKSVSEFWSRWHITLSTWFRDYVFLPIAYAKTRRWEKKKYFLFRTDYLVYIYSALITMTVCGFWHGSGYNFIIWGFIFGLYMSIAMLTKNIRRKILHKIFNKRFSILISIFKILIVFSLVTFAWIFFRSENSLMAFEIIKKVVFNLSSLLNLKYLNSAFAELNLSYLDMPLLIIVILYFIIEYVQEKSGSIREIISKQKFVIRWCLYYSIILIILFWGTSESKQFIYFNF